LNSILKIVISLFYQFFVVVQSFLSKGGGGVIAHIIVIPNPIQKRLHTKVAAATMYSITITYKESQIFADNLLLLTSFSNSIYFEEVFLGKKKGKNNMEF
jgi:hypothetical protein